jgi:uncharacterized membrane protein YraQ (UPF0718 family)/copper chaperone CopZ
MSIISNIWMTFHELAPWLLLGTIISSLLHKFLPTGFIHQQLQGKKGVLKAVMLGVPLPLCSCGVIPAGLGLKKDGSSDGATIGFIISTPQTGIDSILVSASFLGWPFAIFKVIAAAVTGIIGGLLGEALLPAPQTNSNTTIENKVVSWNDTWEHGLEILRSIWKWLLFGVLLSALISEFISPNQIQGLGTVGTIGAMLGALLISVPLYVCATASVPIAAALVYSGFPLGAALVFLMAGPATNIATIGAIRQELGNKATTIYLSTVVLGSLSLGWGFDFLLSDIPQMALHSHETEHWATATVLLLIGLFLLFLIEELKLKFQKIEVLETAIEVPIEGLTCGGCVNKLSKVLNADENVQKVFVSLEEHKAVIETTLSLDEIKERVKTAGFLVPS